MRLMSPKYVRTTGLASNRHDDLAELFVQFPSSLRSIIRSRLPYDFEQLLFQPHPHSDTTGMDPAIAAWSREQGSEEGLPEQGLRVEAMMRHKTAGLNVASTQHRQQGCCVTGCDGGQRIEWTHDVVR